MTHFKKSIALLTLLTFSAQTLIWASPDGPRVAAWSSRPWRSAGAATDLSFALNRPSEYRLSPLEIQIPAELGDIKESFDNPSRTGLVIHIQNAHGNYQAQRHIQKLIRYLNKKYGIRCLFLEGANDKLDPGVFRFFNDNRLNFKTADILMRHGEFTGAEKFLLEEPGKAAGYGIEDTALYRQDFELFRKVMGGREKAQSFLTGLQQTMDAYESHIFSKELRYFAKEWRKFQKAGDGLLGFVRTLHQYGLRYLSIDIQDPRYQETYGALLRVLKLQELEKRLDPAKIEREKKALLEFLRGKIDETLYARLACLGDRSHKEDEIYPRFLFEEVLEQGAAKGLAIDFRNYPNFTLFAERLIFQSELDSEKLFEEAETLSEKIFEALSETEDQKELVRTIHETELLKKLFSLELSRREYEKTLLNKERLNPRLLVNRLTKLGVKMTAGSISHSKPSKAPQAPSRGEESLGTYGTGSAQELFYDALKFYELAAEREKYFLVKTLETMRQEKQSTAIVVTGGFHAEGFQNLLKEKGISHLSIIPRVANAKRGHAIYLRSMMGKTKLFESAHIEKALRELSPVSRENLVGPELIAADHALDLEAAKIAASLGAALRPAQTKFQPAEIISRAMSSLGIKLAKPKEQILGKRGLPFLERRPARNSREKKQTAVDLTFELYSKMPGYEKEQLLSKLGEWGQEFETDLWDGQEGDAFVAYWGQAPIGAQAFDISDPKSAYAMGLYVDKNFRQRGWRAATRLRNQLMAHLKERGFKKLSVGISQRGGSESEAQKFHKWWVQYLGGDVSKVKYVPGKQDVIQSIVVDLEKYHPTADRNHFLNAAGMKVKLEVSTGSSLGTESVVQPAFAEFLRQKIEAENRMLQALQQEIPQPGGPESVSAEEPAEKERQLKALRDRLQIEGELSRLLAEKINSAPLSADSGHKSEPPLRVRSLEEVERTGILRAIIKHKGNVRKATREIGFASNTVYRKLTEYEVMGEKKSQMLGLIQVKLMDAIPDIEKLDGSYADAEKAEILWALWIHEGDIEKAAEELGVNARQGATRGLGKKLINWGINASVDEKAERIRQVREELPKILMAKKEQWEAILRNEASQELENRTAMLKGDLKSKPVMDLDGISYAIALYSEAARRALIDSRIDPKIHSYVGGEPQEKQIEAALLLLANRTTVRMLPSEGKTLSVGLAGFLKAIAGLRVEIHDWSKLLSARDAQVEGAILYQLGMRVAAMIGKTPYEFALQGETFPHLKPIQQAGGRPAIQRMFGEYDIVYGPYDQMIFLWMNDWASVGNHKIHPTESPRAVIVEEGDTPLLDNLNKPLAFFKELYKLGELPDMVYQLVYGYAHALIEQQRAGNIRYKVTSRKVSILKERREAVLRALRAKLSAVKGALEFVDRLDLLDLLHAALETQLIYQEKKQYLVKREPKGGHKGKIILINENTGEIHEDERLSRGLHTFLEIKHGLAIQKESNIELVMTTYEFYSRIRAFSAVMGYLGDGDEDRLKQLYGLDVKIMEPFHPNRRIDLEPRYYLTEEDKFKAIAELAKKIYLETRRPVLINAQTPFGAEGVADKIKQLGFAKTDDLRIIDGQNEEANARDWNRMGDASSITISAQIASRGQEIKLEPWLYEDPVKAEINGEQVSVSGLFVIGSHHSRVERVEEQVKTRTARRGEPGVALIVDHIAGNRFLEEYVSDELAEFLITPGVDVDSEENRKTVIPLLFELARLRHLRALSQEQVAVGPMFKDLVDAQFRYVSITRKLLSQAEKTIPKKYFSTFVNAAYYAISRNNPGEFNVVLQNFNRRMIHLAQAASLGQPGQAAGGGSVKPALADGLGQKQYPLTIQPEEETPSSFLFRYPTQMKVLVETILPAIRTVYGEDVLRAAFLGVDTGEELASFFYTLKKIPQKRGIRFKSLELIGVDHDDEALAEAGERIRGGKPFIYAGWTLKYPFQHDLPFPLNPKTLKDFRKILAAHQEELVKSTRLVGGELRDEAVLRQMDNAHVVFINGVYAEKGLAALLKKHWSAQKIKPVILTTNRKYIQGLKGYQLIDFENSVRNFYMPGYIAIPDELAEAIPSLGPKPEGKSLGSLEADLKDFMVAFREPFEFDHPRIQSFRRNLEQWMKQNPKISWDAGPRYGRAEAELDFFPGHPIEVYPGELWKEPFPELEKLEKNRGGFYPEPGAFGHVTVSWGWQGDQVALIIDEIQPGDGYRKLTQEQRKHLDGWKRETMTRIIKWAESKGVLLFGTSPEIIQEIYPKISAYEIEENYRKPYDPSLWELQDLPLTHVRIMHHARRLRSWWVYKGNKQKLALLSASGAQSLGNNETVPFVQSWEQAKELVSHAPKRNAFQATQPVEGALLRGITGEAAFNDILQSGMIKTDKAHGRAGWGRLHHAFTWATGSRTAGSFGVIFELPADKKEKYGVSGAVVEIKIPVALADISRAWLAHLLPGSEFAEDRAQIVQIVLPGMAQAQSLGEGKAQALRETTLKELLYGEKADRRLHLIDASQEGKVERFAVTPDGKVYYIRYAVSFDFGTPVSQIEAPWKMLTPEQGEDATILNRPALKKIISWIKENSSRPLLLAATPPVGVEVILFPDGDAFPVSYVGEQKMPLLDLGTALHAKADTMFQGVSEVEAFLARGASLGWPGQAAGGGSVKPALADGLGKEGRKPEFVLKVALPHEQGGITEGVLLIQDQETLRWAMKELGLLKDESGRALNEASLAFKRGELDQVIFQRLGVEESKSPEGGASLVLFPGVMTAGKRSDQETLAESFTNSLEAEDRVVLIRQDNSTLLDALIRSAGRQGVRVRTVRDELVSASVIDEMINDSQRPAIVISPVGERRDLETNFKGRKFKFNDEELKGRVDKVKVIGLLRKIADYPEKFNQIGIVSKDGYWEIGGAFAQFIEKLYGETRAEELQAKAA